MNIMTTNSMMTATTMTMMQTKYTNQVTCFILILTTNGQLCRSLEAVNSVTSEGKQNDPAYQGPNSKKSVK
jgi:hypothetical protein